MQRITHFFLWSKVQGNEWTLKTLASDLAMYVEKQVVILSFLFSLLTVVSRLPHSPTTPLLCLSFSGTDLFHGCYIVIHRHLLNHWMKEGNQHWDVTVIQLYCPPPSQPALEGVNLPTPTSPYCCRSSLASLGPAARPVSTTQTHQARSPRSPCCHGNVTRSVVPVD